MKFALGFLTIMLPALTGMDQKPATAVLWNEWYTVSGPKDSKLAYYNERAEEKDGKIHIQMDLWKKEDSFLNEEHVVAIIETGAKFVTHFYSVRNKHRSTESKLEANLRDKKKLQVTIAKAGAKPKTFVEYSRKNTFPAVAFPVWLKENMSDILARARTTHTFQSFTEDMDRTELRYSRGSVKRDRNQTRAETEAGIIRLAVQFSGRSSTWWVDSKEERRGSIEKIEFKDSGVRISRAAEKDARKFLN